MIVQFFRFIGFVFKYLFNPQPSDELAYIRSLLEAEIKHRIELENVILVHLRVKPNIDFIPSEQQRSYLASSPQVEYKLHEPVRRGGIGEFRRSQAAAEKARLTKEVDADLKRKNPSYNPELARDIAELDAELGTDNERASNG